ncbi:polyprenyl synthetase family protein [Radiobacillus sp. PE A8.2]|uniref:polyprenyl synthetase family protein n=1 Tax=Radiobacillus sp. PE A8.2 TaxID=3380349 RepID=UPI00389060F6
MKEQSIINADRCYRKAEEKAAAYFTSLLVQIEKQAYVPILTKDFQAWKPNHIHHRSILSLFVRGQRNSDKLGYHKYIQWLNHSGKLENYLDRSISYIYMRDLGKSLASSETQDRIQDVVKSLKNQVINDQGDSGQDFTMAGLYRWAQREGVESAVIWVIDKLRTVSTNIPSGMDVEHAQRKLIKTIAGVVMHEMEEMHTEIQVKERTKKLDRAIRLGFSYGLTYPFIDDLLDAAVLSKQEKEQYSDLIRTTLVSGSVPELGEWTGENASLIKFVHSELRDAFEYIKKHQPPETANSFFEQSYVFFHSQEVDRIKQLSNQNYTNEEIYIPIILKSSCSRLIARSVISASEDEGFQDRTFYYGIYNQLADDFADMFNDLEVGAVTPFTYYLKYHHVRPDLINPFELYWAVITHLIHDVYQSDMKTCEVILDRAINGLKRFKERVGIEEYNQVMKLFTVNMSTFNRIVQKLVRKADDVDFFDKLIRDHFLAILKNDRKEKQEFKNQVKSIRKEINSILYIPETDSSSTMNDPIIDAANYSLKGDGKRLRPIVTWVMGVKAYQLDRSAIIPLLKSLEYMHTASLILDDLPSQDNASIRRGRPTLHEVYNIAIAELTSVFLTQKATSEQASLDFDSKTVLRLIEYSSKMTAEMCKGQALDLESKGKQLTLEQLNLMCFYKTGLGFEAALIMPAILGQVEQAEMNALKKFAYHAGVAFQIKDDLLDVEGNASMLGKQIGKDAENNSSTFVSILGHEGAKKEMWEHFCLATESLEDVQNHCPFLNHFLSYMIHRNY